MDAGLSEINIDHRAIDVPLSPLGEEQSIALGRWFAHNKADGVPRVVLASPYARADRGSIRLSARYGHRGRTRFLPQRVGPSAGFEGL